MGPINQNAMARGLLDWFGDDRPVVDRATLLPIGQYEDGGLTFAWPGFLKDAWEGAQRTYLDAGNVPVPDAAPGTRWSSNVDALNAASIAPMAGVAGRAAGIPVAVAPAAPMPKIQNLGLRAVTEPGSSFSYRITSNGADTPLSVRGNVSGDEAYIRWIGDWNNKSDNINSLGVGGLRALREQIRKDYPNVTRFRGDRISGANPDRMQSVAMHANPDTASLPALAAETSGVPVSARTWRGVENAEHFLGKDGWLGGDGRPIAWFADNPRTASVYTGEIYGQPSREGSAIYPTDLSFSNALVVDGERKRIFDLDVGAILSDAMKGGHDGLVFRNVVDHGPGGVPMRQDQYVALRPGTVRSATTGEVLFANDPRAAASGLLGNATAQPQGLLGGEPQPALPPLFASAEPYSLERPTDPVLGPFEMPGRWDFPFDLDRQKWQDERYQSPIDLPAPEDQFRPTFRPFAGLMR